MSDPFSRTRMLLGQQAMEKLAASRVAVFGIGGVGGHVCEALVRSGVGAFDLVDDDRVDPSNLNRQIIATTATLGQYKTDAMARRMRSINPDVRVTVYRRLFLPENAAEFPFEAFDYIVDAVDTVAAKLALAVQARDHAVPIISAMGAGNKLDPGRLRVADIAQSHTCPLARVMRRELKKLGITHMKVVFSDEPPVVPAEEAVDPALPQGRDGRPGRRSTPGSTAFVPAVAGLMIAGEAVRDLAGMGQPILPF